MSALREAAQQALEALEHAPGYSMRRTDAMDALRAALAEPPCATRECMPSECPGCISLQDQNTELDRKLAELEKRT